MRFLKAYDKAMGSDRPLTRGQRAALGKRLRDINDGSMECSERGHAACLHVSGKERQAISERLTRRP